MPRIFTILFLNKFYSRSLHTSNMLTIHDRQDKHHLQDLPALRVLVLFTSNILTFNSTFLSISSPPLPIVVHSYPVNKSTFPHPSLTPFCRVDVVEGKSIKTTKLFLRSSNVIPCYISTLNYFILVTENK